MSQQRLDDRRSSRPAAVRHQDTKFEIELVVKFIGNKCWTTVSREKKSREPTWRRLKLKTHKQVSTRGGREKIGNWAHFSHHLLDKWTSRSVQCWWVMIKWFGIMIRPVAAVHFPLKRKIHIHDPSENEIKSHIRKLARFLVKKLLF